MVQIATDNTFEELVINSTKPVLLDIWAPWCGPCKTLGPIVDQIAEEYTDWNVVKINADENTDTVSSYGIRNLPTILFFNNGEIVNKTVGLKTKEELIEKMNNI